MATRVEASEVVEQFPQSSHSTNQSSTVSPWTTIAAPNPVFLGGLANYHLNFVAGTIVASILHFNAYSGNVPF